MKALIKGPVVYGLPVVRLIGPVVAPDGTVVTRLVAVAAVSVAGLPLKAS